MTNIDDKGISINISAADLNDAKLLFRKCVELIETGERFNGKLVMNKNRKGSGCAQLYTHL